MLSNGGSAIFQKRGVIESTWEGGALDGVRGRKEDRPAGSTTTCSQPGVVHHLHDHHSVSDRRKKNMSKWVRISGPWWAKKMDLPRFDFSRGDPNFSTEDPNFHFGTIFYVGWFGQPYLAGSGLVQSGGCHWAHQISGSCWFYLIFCQFGVLRAQKLLKCALKCLYFQLPILKIHIMDWKECFLG